MIVYGRNHIFELLTKKPEIVIEVYGKSTDTKLVSLAEKKQKKFNPIEFDFIQKNKFVNASHQNTFCKIQNPKILNTNEILNHISQTDNSSILLLDQISDPQNFGAIIRNAIGFGCDAIIVSKGNMSPLSASAMKASGGNWFKIKIAEDNMLNAIRTLKRSGFWVVGLDSNSTHELSHINEFNKPLAYVLSSEGKGMRKVIGDNVDMKLKIDISSQVESLNVASTSAIVLHNHYKNRVN